MKSCGKFKVSKISKVSFLGKFSILFRLMPLPVTKTAENKIKKGQGKEKLHIEMCRRVWSYKLHTNFFSDKHK
jgi:hypothetical protein